VAGSTAASSGESIGASYKVAGFTVSAGFAENKANLAAVPASVGPPAVAAQPAYTGKSSQIDFIGVGYEFAPFAVRAQYQQFKSGYNNLGDNASDVKDFGIGFDWTAGANKLNLAIYDAKDDGPNLGGKTREIALLDTYGLSKRTSIYGQIASLKSDANSGVDAGLGGIYTPVGLFNATGATTLFIGLGVQHTF
jgi:predicted porin